MKTYIILLFTVVLFSCDNTYDVIEEPDTRNEYCEYTECDVIKAKHQLLIEQYNDVNSFVKSIANATPSECQVSGSLLNLLHYMNRKSDDINYRITLLEESGCI